MKTSFKILIVGFALLISMGCGGEYKVKLPSPVAVSGKVTFADGQPVKNVLIYLHPLSAEAPASGVVAEDGSFSLKTYDDKLGAVPGKYAVTFKPITNSKTEKEKSIETMKKIPTKYINEDSPSPLEVEITSAKELTLKLDAR